MTTSLGIDIGSTNVKACLVSDGQLVWSEVRAHEGNLREVIRRTLTDRSVAEGIPALVTGHEGRRHFALRGIIEPVAIEKALSQLALDVTAVVSIGGEDLVVYTVDQARIVGTFAGNKCASGTGEFFAQQLKRMDLRLDAVHSPEVHAATVHPLSARCSVFMKSDCTHKLNKGEAHKHDIVLSLTHVMARKVLEFLAKAKVTSGRVLLSGGATNNPHLVRYIREGLPTVEFIVPPQAPALEAFGAALLAQSQGEPLPPIERLLGEAASAFATDRPLREAADRVKRMPSPRAKARPEREYVLGIDGGSTTTKVALVDRETKEIVASHYGRTLGDPITALKGCLVEVKKQLAEAMGEGVAPTIRMVATTGSSRELLGVFCETGGIYNEIIAHTVGTTFFEPDIDTLFEIGGQDAKYVHLRNRVPVDYAMNEACSAGTGSFLEESASGDLDIKRAEEIGPIALEADAPLRFGEHCSAFINSDIRKAIQQGASRPNIMAGLVLSIVANYLNRVVGNRRIGNHIVLQGGVAKNPAVPMAFAALLGKPVTVPPDPELMGCFGVALLAIEKERAGELELGTFTLDGLQAREIEREKEYRCKACDNSCPIRILKVGESRYHFGGRCNKYANLRKKPIDVGEVVDYVEVRRKLYFEEFAPDAETLAQGTPEIERRKNLLVAIPAVFSVHSLWPLYSNFFHALGVRVKLVSEQTKDGAAKVESSFCFPAELAHAMTDAALLTGADFVFLPHFKAMPSYEEDVHACLCPITQGLPYYLRTALGIDDAKILRPMLDLTKGLEGGLEEMLATAARLGATEEEARKAYALAMERQQSCYREGRRIGGKVLEAAKTSKRPVIVLCGRPYNAFAQEASMGIPRKLTTRGYSVLPYDFVPLEDEKLLPNMYWYYGQQDLKAAVQVKNHPNAFVCYITNFSCAPDSFILHYLRWISNTRPFLVLELDSHTADAGLDTRIEAFLDIIEGYRKAKVVEEPMLTHRDWDVSIEEANAFVINRSTKEKVGLKDPRVTMIFPSMGAFATQLFAATSCSYGIRSIALPPSDVKTAARARAVASGKECIPALLVLGSFLQFFEENTPDPEKIYLLFMPLTTGPCRTGQYAIYYQGLFEELGYKNVVVISLNSDNSYAELGSGFNKCAWWSVVLSDYMFDAELAVRALAKEKPKALALLTEIREEMVAAARVDPEALTAGLEGWGKRMATIEMTKPPSEARKVLIVGEIFVRRDDYSVDPLVSNLTEQGIVPKIAGLSEWVYYLDYDQKRKFKKELARMSMIKRPFSKAARKLAWLGVETLWKHNVESKIAATIGGSGLVIKGPHDMDQIMDRSSEFTTPELESEASLSPCVAAIAMEEGYDGVAIIAPFACLPGRIIEAMYAPWARARQMPVISLENDGNPYPPNVVSRIEVFAHNVNRGIVTQEISDRSREGCCGSGCGKS